MPFQIINKDIMKMKVDEVINYESHYDKKELCEQTILSALFEAHNSGCKTIAIPIELIDKYKVTRNDGLNIVLSAVKKFLIEKDMIIYLVIKKDDSFILTDSIYTELNRYLFKKVVVEEEKTSNSFSKYIESFDKKLRKTFSENIIKLIDKKGFSDVEVSYKANIDRNKLIKIINNKYIPDKLTVLALVVALELNLDETRELLSSVEMRLLPNIKSNLIIEYFIENKIYDIYMINLALFQHCKIILG